MLYEIELDRVCLILLPILTSNPIILLKIPNFIFLQFVTFRLLHIEKKIILCVRIMFIDAE